jgi:tartronate-semialdehyde synthase
MDFDNIPTKLQSVHTEMNELFDEDTDFVTAIGLYRIWSRQFHKTYKPRHYLCCGQAGSLGWEVPACIGPSSTGRRTSSKWGVWQDPPT